MRSLAKLRLLAVLATLAVTAALASAEGPATKPTAQNWASYIKYDFAAFNPAALQHAADALVGPRASELNEPLAEFKAFHDQLDAVGVTGMQVIGVIPEGGPTTNVRVLSLKPGADTGAVKAMVANTFSPEPASDVAYDRVGDELIVHPADQPLLAADAGGAARFAAPLAAAGDRGFVVCVVPNAGLADVLEKAVREGNPPPFVTALVASLGKSKWVSFGLNVGDTPDAVLAIEQPDRASADELRGQIDVAIGQLKELVAPMQAQLKKDGKAAKADAIDILLGKLKPTQDGARLTVAFDAETTKLAAPFVLDSFLQARQSAKEVQSVSNMRQISIGIILYTNEHHGAFPDTLDQVGQYLGGAGRLQAAMQNPTRSTVPGYVYVKPAAKVTGVRRSATTPMLYESLDGKPDPNGYAAYADGHVERLDPNIDKH